MDERIEIPTSEPDRPRARRPSRPGRAISLIGIVVALIVVLTMGEFGGGGSDPAVGEDEIAPPPIVEGGRPSPALNAFALPGTGTVTAILEVDGVLVATAAGDHWGSSIWRLDDTSGTWSLAISLPGVTILDAIEIADGMAVVGFDLFDRTPMLLAGPPDQLRPVPLDLGTGEVPYRVDHEAGSLYLSSRFGDGSIRAPASVYRIEPDGRSTLLEPGADAMVEDVFTSDGVVLAVGSERGRPAMWRVGPGGGLESIDVDLGIDVGRIAAAGRLASGDVVGLVVGGFGSDLPSTAVHRLDPPYDRLNEPIPGVWDRLVPAGAELLALPENLLALPASGMPTDRTESGIVWLAGRARFTGPGGGGQADGTIVISDAVFRASAGLVLAGASSGQESSPIVAAEAPIGSSASVPSARWLALDDAEPSREIVHVGGIQVSVSQGVVTVRDAFGQPWYQPVFADETSVGGLVEVVELEFGYLLSATQPYSSLWYSTDGSAWQLVERDVIRIAGSDDAAIAVVGTRDAPSILGIDSSGLVEVAAEVDRSVTAAEGLARVDSVGYVAGPVAGAVYVSETGAEWSALEIGVDVDAIHFGTNTFAVRTGAGWFRYDGESRGLAQMRSPDDEALRLQVAPIDGGLLFADRALAWVTTDFLGWTEVSLGAWQGADGVLLGVWADEQEVVALLGGPSQRTFFMLRR